MAGLAALVVVTLVILAAFWRYARSPAEVERSDRLRRVAARLGLDFTDEGEPVFLSAMHPFTILQAGQVPRFRNLMYGILEKVEVAAFDLHYEAGGKQRALTICSFHVTGMLLPRFELRCKSTPDDLLPYFGYRDLISRHLPEFSPEYILGGEPEEAVRALFPSRALDRLRALWGFCLEGQGDILLFYRPGLTAAPEEIEPMLRDALQALVPFIE